MPHLSSTGSDANDTNVTYIRIFNSHISKLLSDIVEHNYQIYLLKGSW